jgi:hypothetical protein
MADTASGSAIAKPTSFTVSCTTLTRADARRPPAEKYTMTTSPPTMQPIETGSRATVLRMDPIASS